jgi:hypothetical protein
MFLPNSSADSGSIAVTVHPASVNAAFSIITTVIESISSLLYAISMLAGLP